MNYGMFDEIYKTFLFFSSGKLLNLDLFVSKQFTKRAEKRM